MFLLVSIKNSLRRRKGRKYKFGDFNIVFVYAFSKVVNIWRQAVNNQNVSFYSYAFHTKRILHMFMAIYGKASWNNMDLLPVWGKIYGRSSLYNPVYIVLGNFIIGSRYRNHAMGNLILDMK